MFLWKRLLNKNAYLLIIFSSILFSGCASQQPTNPEDPYENFNRKVFAFNTAIDHAAIRPIAKGYNFITPNVVQHGVTNFFSNVNDVRTAANDALQLNFYQLNWDLWRVFVNTTFGIGGVFDVATNLGLTKNRQDFGLTLARWGYTNSNYLILPLLGPRTVRDAIGVPADIVMLPSFYIEPWYRGVGYLGFNFISDRANLLPYDKLVDDAFNPYVAFRNAYMQNRKARVAAIIDEKHKISNQLPEVRG